jgi:hypothetical protein
LYYRIQTRESVVCKLRKKYMTVWRRLTLGQQSSDTVSFIFFACRIFQDFWQQLLGSVGISHRAGGGASKKRLWLCPPWNVAQIPIPFSGHNFQTNLADHSKHCSL